MANLTDADKVLRNDTGKDIVTQLTAIKTAIENGGGGGGGASTVSQLTDVLLSSTIPDGDVLVRDNNLTGGKLWKNKTITVELTQAEYDDLANPLPDVDYYITDAPSMQGTSADLSYDGTTLSTYDKIEEVVDYIDNKIAVSDITSSLNIDTNYFSASTKQVYKSGNTVNICLRGSLTATNGTILGTIATYYPKANRIICEFHNNGAPTPITTGAVWLNGENGRMYYFGGSVTSLDVCITATYICN